MDKFDIRSAKLIAIIGLILFIFIMVVANAYQYLPSENSDIPSVNNEINLPADEDNNSEDSDNDSAYDNEEENSYDTRESRESVRRKENSSVSRNTDNESSYSNDNITPLENISDDNNSNADSDSDRNFEDIFSEAKDLKNDKQLVKSISAFNDAAKVAETSKQKADCYEEIANIYAVAKKYGTALSFAQKAYNMSPSTSREILLARLYYKTGNADKASDRMNNVLRRDFTQDN